MILRCYPIAPDGTRIAIALTMEATTMSKFPLATALLSHLDANQHHYSVNFNYACEATLIDYNRSRGEGIEPAFPEMEEMYLRVDNDWNKPR